MKKLQELNNRSYISNYWWITQDEYDKKAIELKQRQYELNNQLKKII